MKDVLFVVQALETQRGLRDIMQVAFPGVGIAQAGTAEQVGELTSARSFGVAVIDLDLPDGLEIDVIRMLRAISPETDCVVAATSDSDDRLFTAIEEGAKGYVLKHWATDQIVATLKDIILKSPIVSPSATRQLDQSFESIDRNQPRDLTRREKDVLTLIAKGHTMTEAAVILGISRHTVAGYVKNIYEKLNISSRAEAALEATRRGLVKPV